MGEYFVDAVTTNDVNSVAGVTLFVAILVEQLLRTLPITQLQSILLAVLAILMVTLLAAPRRLLTTT
jgi:hypothetical protein